MTAVMETRKRKIAEGLIEYVDEKGRVGFSELMKDVWPRTTISHNEFVMLLDEMCEKAQLMVACVDQGGPRYQVFTYAFAPVQVDHTRYLKAEADFE